jgi:site-specific DNA-adenine methylase
MMPNLKNTAISDATTCSLVYERFGGICHLYLHSRQLTILKMMVAGSSEPLVNIYQTIRHPIPVKVAAMRTPNLTSNFILRKIHDV